MQTPINNLQSNPVSCVVCVLMMDEAHEKEARAPEKKTSRLELNLQHLIDLDYLWKLSKDSAEV